jgi:hypothetical protein
MANSNDIDQMADLMAIMNGQTPSKRMTVETRNGKPVENITLPSVGDQANVDAMKNVLSNFYGVNKGMERVAMTLVDDSGSDSTLRTAMVTEATDDGVSIGEWEIYLKEEGKRKFYDVVNERNGMVIAADLTLYEAAFGIARSLADGLPITSPVIRSILQAEGEYAAALIDATHHKHNMKKALTEGRRSLLEDRYEISKQKALSARRRVEDLVKPPF